MNTKDSTQTQINTETENTYENNPLYVATNGLDLLFKKALSIGIVLAIISALSLFGGGPTSFAPKAEEKPATGTSSSTDGTNFMNALANVQPEMWLIIGLIVVAILVVMILVITFLQGITDVTSAHLSKGNKIGITEAVKEVFENFWGYLWVLIVTNVKIFLWTLLFIIPGIIMAIRYSLSGVVYFDKKLKGNASVLESSRLTKGAWLTTYASQLLLNMLTLGFIAPILMPGTNAVLYRQFSETPEVKPKAHILSWLTLIIPFVIVVLVISILLYAAANFLQST